MTYDVGDVAQSPMMQPTEAELQADYEAFKPSLAMSARASRAVLAAYFKQHGGLCPHCGWALAVHVTPCTTDAPK